VFELVDDLTSRVVTTVAEQSGVLVRAMGAPLRQRPVEELGLDELVLRYFAYMETIQPTEHARLREAFEKALEREPSHALGWAHLSFLYQQEHSHGMNTRPEPLERCARAAARSIEVDPTCQAGWEATATARFFDRDLTGLRVAADRVIALNPLSASVVWMGSLLALAGEWERGTELVRRAMERNPQHAGWYELSISIDACRRGAFDAALAATKRANLPQIVFQPLIAAVAAGHLGRAGDARAAIEDLRRHHPAHCDPAAVRRLWSLWTWDAEVVEVMVEGLRKAEALAE
jgi:adenylate cyclase